MAAPLDSLTFAQAQADMRRGYASGAPGVLISGLVWLAAGVVAVTVSDRAAVLALLVGGTVIYPASLVVTKLMGRSGTHSAGNPLGRLAGEGTALLFVGLVIAYGVSVLRVEWFFPVMLLIIGARYLTFQTVYGLRAYWLCGLALIAAGVAVGLAEAPVYVGAFAGGAIELVVAGVLGGRERWTPDGETVR
ncbi:DUF7010 family protein [Rubrivirga sp.]|uniref:DUF7010 family protein n=1 Tax=Rubrivirga sp. TaxID=1885344 RepID=UPI003C78C188